MTQDRLRMRRRAALVCTLLSMIAFAAHAASWQSGGPDNGTITAIAVDPVTPTNVFAGTAGITSTGGGIFRSTDGGTTWSPSSSGLTNLNIRALAINPSTPTTVYAGTPSGIFKSTNSGASWTASNTGLTTLSSFAVAVDPLAPATIYAGTGGGGVFKSTNGAASWTAVNSGLTSTNVGSLAVDNVTPGTLYGDRINELDLRFTYVLKFGRTRSKISLDMYNALNSAPVLTYNQTYSPTTTTWLSPTSVLAARVMKFGASIDF
jgi:hypothetical protein